MGHLTVDEMGRVSSTTRAGARGRVDDDDAAESRRSPVSEVVALAPPDQPSVSAMLQVVVPVDVVLAHAAAGPQHTS